MTRERPILLVEDNPDDEEFTLRALQRAKVTNPVVVIRDGSSAVDYLFGVGEYVGRGAGVVPAVVLLDLKLPKLSGIDVLRRMRADHRTKLVPVVVLTSSSQDEDILRSYESGGQQLRSQAGGIRRLRRRRGPARCVLDPDQPVAAGRLTAPAPRIWRFLRARPLRAAGNAAAGLSLARHFAMLRAPVAEQRR